jgi:hypothetical protein
MGEDTALLAMHTVRVANSVLNSALY